MNDSQKTPEPVPTPIPAPINETDQNHLPAAITFFITKDQRKQILGVLKGFDQNRVAALLAALQIDSK